MRRNHMTLLCAIVWYGYDCTISLDGTTHVVSGVLVYGTRRIEEVMISLQSKGCHTLVTDLEI
jgi:hypothetical protein